MAPLLDRKGAEEVVKVAAGNEISREEVMILLLNRRKDGVQITEAVTRRQWEVR
jgi:hypothetical protein